MTRAALLLWTAIFGPPARVRDAAQTGSHVDLAVRGSARALVPPGSFRMGSDDGDVAAIELLCIREGGPESICGGERYMDEMPPHEVRLAAYRIDRTEVTMAAYGRCVQAGVCRGPMQFPGDHRFDGPTQPVVGVSWEDAGTYCRWVGARLPTEAEWERAARGVDARTFPWGRTWNPSLSSHGKFDAIGNAGFSADDHDGFRYTAPVGSFPEGASPYGLLDMAGNAWEWVADWYQEYEPDPRLPVPQIYRVVRGGSWTAPGTWQRTSMRYYGLPGQRSLEIGFRCAEDAS